MTRTLALLVLTIGCSSAPMPVPELSDPGAGDAMDARPRFDAARAPDAAPTPDAHAPSQDGGAVVTPRPDGSSPDIQSSAPSPKGVVDLWIPEGVRVLRGAIVATQHSKMGEVPYQSWRVMCKAWGFAYVGTNHEFLAADTDSFFEKLDRIAAERGHPELAHVPLLCRGFSAGGGACIRVAKRRASRVIAVVSNGNPGASFEDTTRDTFKALPVLTVNGSVDPYVGGLKWITDVYWPKVRGHDLAWGLAILWKGDHSWGNTNFLLYPFLDRVIQQRLPADYDPTKGPATLRPARVQDGWLGDMAGWTESSGTQAPRPVASYAAYPGDRTRAAWSPDAYVAAVWRAVSVSAHPFAFVKPSPGSTNTSNTIALLRAEQPLEVEMTGAPEGTRIYAGNQLLGKLSGGRLTVAPGVLSRGYHALLAFGDTPEGERAALPRQIYVGDLSIFGTDAP